MTRQKSTKKALLSSVLSLVICLSMLIGTTFAWFTDSVTSANNKIQSGTLKLDLELLDKESGNWNSIKTSQAPLFNYNKWEPGYTEARVLKVQNEGTLALKWMAKFVSANKLSILANVIDVYVCEGATAYPTRELTGYTRVGTVAEFVNTIETTTTGTLLAGKEATLGIALKMQESAGNEYQGLDLGGAFDIQILATQLTSEIDSFDDQYDKNATFIPAWDGTTGEVPPEVDNTISISTPAELSAFANSVNSGKSYSGKTVKLTADINLDNQNWTPIGACNSTAYFQGVFDGQGHTIYGLNVDKANDTYMYTTAGLFGWIDAGAATIKNVKLDGATVKGSHWVGGIAGYMTGNIINCSVTNSTIIGYNVNDDANGDKVGGVVGYMNTGNGSLEGNTVTNCTITAYRDVAGIAGAVAVENSVKNNTVKDTKISYEANHAAKIVSAKTAVVVDDTNKADNVIVGKITTLTTGNLYDTIASMKKGDTLIVAGGTYNTSGSFPVPEGVTIKGKDGETVIIHQSSAAQDNIFNCAGDVVIENITFESNRKGYAIADNTKNHDTDGDITVINCKFLGLASEKNWGIYKNLNGNLTIQNCTFDNYNNAVCGVNNGNGSTTTITGCTFTNINGEAVGYVMSSTPADFETKLIENNTGLTDANVIGY